MNQKPFTRMKLHIVRRYHPPSLSIRRPTLCCCRLGGLPKELSFSQSRMLPSAAKRRKTGWDAPRQRGPADVVKLPRGYKDKYIYDCIICQGLQKICLDFL